jgi:hypothetical protein
MGKRQQVAFGSVEKPDRPGRQSKFVRPKAARIVDNDQRGGQALVPR